MQRTLKVGPGFLTRDADVKQTSQDRTIELTWTTGSKGLRNSWKGPYYEELSMRPEHIRSERLNSGTMPVLASHDSESLNSVIGILERWWIEGNEAKALVRFSEDPEADRIFKKIKERILRNVSVGYKVHEFTDLSRKGDEIPTYRATDWEPLEVSIVPIGFDAAAQIRSTTQNEPYEVRIINSLEREQIMSADNAPKSGAQQEKLRQKELRQLVRDAGLEASVADRLIENDTTVEAAKDEVLRELIMDRKIAAQPKAPSSILPMEVGLEPQDKMREAVVDSIGERIISNYKPSVDTRSFKGLSLIGITQAYLRRRLGETDSGLATRAMSSSDLPHILANSAEKALQQRYAAIPKSWSQWAKSSTLRNYKQASHLRGGDMSALLARSEGSEYKYGSMSEERELVQLADYGIIHAFTSQMLVNDDLQALSVIVNENARQAAILENELVYGVLTSNPTMGDGTALFHSSHGNLAGSGAALSDTTIGAAVLAMRQQTTVDGKKLNLEPKYLICGPSNEVLAKKYLALINPSQASNVNPFSGSMELIVDAEISSNDYFFACSPDQVPTVILYRLEGKEQPQVSSRVRFETDSVEFKVAHACVAAAADWRGLYKDPNAS